MVAPPHGGILRFAGNPYSRPSEQNPGERGHFDGVRAFPARLLRRTRGPPASVRNHENQTARRETPQSIPHSRSIWVRMSSYLRRTLAAIAKAAAKLFIGG